ncbi:efflux RND transporter periplasmic adaptor subunit [Shewanella algae]|uniref:efflux RND transporter periplasmic adaptor subunit n=1 Tax=Shewanella algae TaxID=38313 RepID=UPI002721DD0D|nr:efflux RND transporter periplasmic adaptor subunit [Shewanella algae]MDO8256466.1 efflux RND transporter periplasmic adaptor subunit [Shewanella algae]
MKRFSLAWLALLALSACSDGVSTQVVQGPLSQKIEVTGELVAADTVSLMPPVMRRIWQYQVKQLAPEGSEVESGEMVAQLDTSELTQRLSVKSAELEATVQDLQTSKLRNAKKMEELKLQLAEAKMELDKAERKFALSDDTVAALDKEKYQRDAVIARDKVALVQHQLVLEAESARQREAMLDGDRQKFSAEVAALKKGIASMTLVAPRAGMVVYGNDPQGNKLKEGQSVFAGDVVLSIPDLDSMQVNMAIPEVEARRVKLGQQLKIRLDANPDKVFTGKIKELGAVFRNKSQEVPLVVFDAVASIDEPDTELMRPGMTAKISIEIADDSQRTLVAQDAVHYEAGHPYVLLDGLLGARKQSVRVGAMGGDQVEILSGLQVGDEVLLP